MLSAPSVGFAQSGYLISKTATDYLSAYLLWFDAPAETHLPTSLQPWRLINHHRAAIALAGRPYPPLPCAGSIDHPWPGAPGRAPVALEVASKLLTVARVLHEHALLTEAAGVQLLASRCDTILPMTIRSSMLWSDFRLLSGTRRPHGAALMPLGAGKYVPAFYALACLPPPRHATRTLRFCQADRHRSHPLLWLEFVCTVSTLRSACGLVAIRYMIEWP